MASQTRPALFPRDLRRRYRTISHGIGLRLYDTEGREYIDADSGAISVVSIGHGVEEVVEAMAQQARRLAYVHNGQFVHEAGEELAQAIARFTPEPLNRSILVSGGSEAVETAAKLCRHYHLLRGRPDKQVVLSRRYSYHGATIIALSLSGISARQAPYRPYMLDTPKVAEPYCYRCPLHLERPTCGIACADELERAIAELGPNRVSAFIAEPVVGAAGPGITPPPGYFERIRDICDAHDVLFVCDEVVTGFGRTGRNFGIEHWDAVPDVIVSAKGLAGGYAPLAAVIMADHISDAFEDASTSFVHGLTYEAHPVACAAALAVLRIIERDQLVENAAVQGQRLHTRLQELATVEPMIGDVRGLGLLAGVELVANRSTRQPYPLDLGLTWRVWEAAQEHGLMVYPGAAADGDAGDQIVVSPPLTVTADEVDLIVDRLALALADARPV
jgi:adenosylmethionine-8-amino-7-oxononanoate aminotransferase